MAVNRTSGNLPKIGPHGWPGGVGSGPYARIPMAGLNVGGSSSGSGTVS
jgi:hypothetical protein